MRRWDGTFHLEILSMSGQLVCHRFLLSFVVVFKKILTAMNWFVEDVEPEDIYRFLESN